ncbi:hypothetical protein niasHT_033545 [Heterodera trifolii]|uniref:Uncharacterized protein n=1 Tax=Heterodera trifolii TaxID=157864 RepID=A0ABD2HYW4_9BILA
MIDTDLCPCPLTNMKVQKAEYIVVIKDHEEAKLNECPRNCVVLSISCKCNAEMHRTYELTKCGTRKNIGRPEQERSVLRLKTAIGMELVQLEIIFEAMPANFDEIHFNQRHWACLSFDAIIAGGQELHESGTNYTTNAAEFCHLNTNQSQSFFFCHFFRLLVC